MTLSEKVLEVALSQVGVEERPRGSNRGPEVEQYLASVHLPPGNPWCAAFVSWCVREAVKEVGGPPEFVASGGALGLLRINPGLAVDQPGDEACYIFAIDHGGGKGHAGLWVPRGLTIEGNSNETGSREGYMVCRLTRPIESFKGLLRIG
jgi:hypothetical protein